MEIQDDRTEEQKTTHPYLIIGTDSFMSGWGKADNGVSYAAWAAEAEHVDAVLRWVESRSEMKRVRFVDERAGKYRPTGTGHCHIYVVTKGHRALETS